MFLQVTEAHYLDAYRIEVVFNNGKKGIADLVDALKGPVFEPLKNPEAFANFKIDPDFQIDFFSIVSDNFDESSSKELNESQFCRSYENKDQLDFSNTPNTVEMGVDNLDIKEHSNNANLVIVQDIELVERSGLAGYGSLLNLFYQDIVQYCKDNNKISLDDLINLYPELTKQGITKWMGILLKEDLIVRDGRKNLYHLT